MLTFENISTENLAACLALMMEAWQEKYAASVAESLSRAYVEPEKLIPLAVCRNQEPIGFLLFRKSGPAKIILIEEFFIDRRFQSDGCGTAALRAFTKLAEEMELYERLFCKTAIGNSWGRNMLEQCGFMRGAVDLEARTVDMVYILQ